MPCKKAPGTQGYKGKLNVPSCRVGKKEGMAEAIQRQEESTSSQQRGSWKLAPSSSERSLPFQLQLFTALQSQKEGTEKEQMLSGRIFVPDIIGYQIRK